MTARTTGLARKPWNRVLFCQGGQDGWRVDARRAGATSSAESRGSDLDRSSARLSGEHRLTPESAVQVERFNLILEPRIKKVSRLRLRCSDTAGSPRNHRARRFAHGATSAAPRVTESCWRANARAPRLPDPPDARVRLVFSTLSRVPTAGPPSPPPAAFHSSRRSSPL